MKVASAFRINFHRQLYTQAGSQFYHNVFEHHQKNNREISFPPVVSELSAVFLPLGVLKEGQEEGGGRKESGTGGRRRKLAVRQCSEEGMRWMLVGQRKGGEEKVAQFKKLEIK